MTRNSLYNNIFITVMILTALVGWDVAHTPQVEVKAYEAPVASPTPISEVTNIKVGEVVVGTPKPEGKAITVKMSHYTPWVGGLNCGHFVDGKCVSKLANGEKWEQYVNKNVVACPKELVFGTKIEIEGKVYTCKDRGGMIKVTPEGHYWLDVLTDKAGWNYGTVLDAKIIE